MKKLLIILGIVAALIAGTLLYFHATKGKDLVPLVTQKLLDLVKNGSNGLYKLTVDSITLNISEGAIVLHNAQIKPDSARLTQMEKLMLAPNDIYQLHVPQLSLDGISAADLLNTKNIHLNELNIKQAEVEIFHQNRTLKQKDSLSFYQRISKQVASFQLNKLLLDQVQFTYHDQENGNKSTQLKNLSCRFSNILIDTTTQNDTTRFLFAKDAVLFIAQYKQLTKNNLYRFSVDSIAINATNRSMSLRGVAFRPAGNKEDFGSKVPYRQDRYDIKLASIAVTNIDWWGLLLNERIQASEVLLQNGQIELYSDKRLRPSGQYKIGSFPHQQLAKINIPVDIGAIRIKDISLFYREFTVQSGQVGEVEFWNANGSIVHVTNIAEKIRQNPFMQMKATASFMKTGSLTAAIRFDLARQKEGIFTVDASVGSMDATTLNKATTALALIEVKEGRINHFSAHLTGNNNQASGSTSIAYQNLKVNVLKKDDAHPGQIKSKGFATFLTNTFILAKSTPDDGKSPLTQQVTFRKSPQQGFWALIWKTILEGIKPTIKGKKDKK